MHDLTLAVLSWKDRKTLRNTLESYKLLSLDMLASERIIYFQEISPEDREIANHYGYQAIGTDANLGIARAYDALVHSSTQPLFLFLENDWMLLEPPQSLISDSVEMLRGNHLDVVRFRHQKLPGHPLWTLQFRGNEYARPTHLLDAVHWTDASRFPEIRVKQGRSGVMFYCASSANANWTNNPTMFRTNWLKEQIVPRLGNRDAELDLQGWWERQNFTVGYASPGLFTHSRIG